MTYTERGTLFTEKEILIEIIKLRGVCGDAQGFSPDDCPIVREGCSSFVKDEFEKNLRMAIDLFRYKYPDDEEELFRILL